MGKRKRIWLSALILAVVGGIAWQFAGSRQPALIYKGQPLDFWLAGYDEGNYKLAHPKGPPPPNREQANEAIRHFGTNAIPILLRMLQERDSKIKVSLWHLLQRQHVVYIPFAAQNPNFTAYAAYAAFQALGPQASNAVPRLAWIYDHDTSAFPQQAVPAILGKIGPAAIDAIPMLTRALGHTNFGVRNNAIYALGEIHAEPRTVLPRLIKFLNDTNDFLRMQAAAAVGKYGEEARSAVPFLLALEERELAAAAGRPGPGPVGGFSFTLSAGPMLGALWPSGGAFAPVDVLAYTKRALESIGTDAVPDRAP